MVSVVRGYSETRGRTLRQDCGDPRALRGPTRRAACHVAKHLGRGRGRGPGRRVGVNASSRAGGIRESSGAGKVATVRETVLEPAPKLVRAPASGLSLLNTLLLVVATFAFVAATWSFRQAMRTFDQACLDTTEAMRATESASREVEKLSLQLEREIPVTLLSVENASLEVEILSQGLQSLTGSLNRNIRQPVQDAVAATVDTSTNVIKRVPSDLNFVADVATMVLGEWRTRLGDTIGNLDKSYFRQGGEVSTRAQREAVAWIESWRARTAEMRETEEGEEGEAAADAADAVEDLEPSSEGLSGKELVSRTKGGEEDSCRSLLLPKAAPRASVQNVLTCLPLFLPYLSRPATRSHWRSRPRRTRRPRRRSPPADSRRPCRSTSPSPATRNDPLHKVGKVIR